MMGTYGLGAGQVIRLQLHSIDWKAGTPRVARPKMGANFVLPLLAPVAKILAQYLRHGRPVHTPTRHLCVQIKGPFAASTAIRHLSSMPTPPVSRRLIWAVRLAPLQCRATAGHRHAGAGALGSAGPPRLRVGVDLRSHRHAAAARSLAPSCRDEHEGRCGVERGTTDAPRRTRCPP